ncbi:MAG: DNA topoisomerase IV subunit A [Solobacterium sp.]|nr:DNA topoisomerase IV subunit A [Solobacterium sp.]
MAKKDRFEDHTKYIPARLEDIMGDRFGRYAKYIIQERALPDARDGLKPVQRRILYAMYHDGNTFDHPYRKSAKTVGLVIGNYHPHGDTSVYDAMVRMSQDWKVRLPLVDMHGNNGSIDDDPAAAMRYTEARLARVTDVMVNDLNKDTVELAPNFDDMEMEPTVLPVPFPVMLVNGAEGIAAGYATNMPPHNLGEVVDATIYRLNNPTCTLDEVMECLPGPDFPTGGVAMGLAGIREAFETGRGRVVVRGRTSIEEGRLTNNIVISEIPYGVVKSELVRQIDEIRINKEIDGIVDVRDETDRNGLKIVIEVKKEFDAANVLNYLYKNTKLQIWFNYNNVAIIDRTPMQVGLLGLLDAFIAFRKEVVLRRSKYEFDRMEARTHVIEGLTKAVSILDEVIAIIRRSKDKADSKRNLMAAFGFDDAQAEAIVTLRLYRLSNTDIIELRDEFAELVNRMDELQSIMENPKVLRSVIVKELREVKAAYGDERRTSIEAEVEDISIDRTKMIANEHVVVTVSRDGYVKRVSMRSYGKGDTATGRKEGDVLVGTAEADTLDTMLLFTSKGNFAYLPVWKIDEFKWKDTGAHLNKYMKISGDDKIVSALLVPNFDTGASIVTVSSLGQIKRTLVEQFQVNRASAVSTCMNLAAGEEMLDAFPACPGERIAVVSAEGFSCQYALADIPAMGLRSRGVKAMNPGKGDHLAAACAFSEDTGALLYITKSGQMKRVKTEEIFSGNRPIKGSLIAKKIKTNPQEMKEVLPVTAGSMLKFFSEEETVLRAGDVPIKTTDTTFSTPLALKEGWYRIKGIPECRIVEKEAQDNPPEQLRLL